MMHRRSGGIAVLLAAAPLLAACGGAAGTGAGDGRPTVVASFYPLQWVSERVAGEYADVEVLTTPGGEPHDVELDLPQLAEVEDADVLVYSAGFQSAVDDAVAQSSPGQVVDAAEVAHLVPVEDGAHEEGEEGEEHGHAEEELDPHFWLDPTRLADVAGAVSDRLSEVDPDHAEDFAANLADLERDLTALDDDLQRGLTGCERDTVVVSHDAFGYLADRYGLEVASINGLSPDAEPSPAQLAELAELIEAEGLTTVFSETLASPALAETLASDLGLRTAVLDPVEGLGDDTADEDYLSLMRANLAALQQANGCA